MLLTGFSENRWFWVLGLDLVVFWVSAPNLQRVNSEVATGVDFRFRVKVFPVKRRASTPVAARV